MKVLFRTLDDCVRQAEMAEPLRDVVESVIVPSRSVWTPETIDEPIRVYRRFYKLWGAIRDNQGDILWMEYRELLG